MRFFAVVDTNILVSAFFNFDSIPGKIVQCVLQNIITPIFNDKMMSEYIEVLHRAKFKFDDELIDFVIAHIYKTGIRLESTDTIDSKNFPDKKDIAFYEVVLTARKSQDTYLVTGNTKHFPEETFVVTARQMLDIIENSA